MARSLPCECNGNGKLPRQNRRGRYQGRICNDLPLPPAILILIPVRPLGLLPAILIHLGAFGRASSFRALPGAIRVVALSRTIEHAREIDAFSCGLFAISIPFQGEGGHMLAPAPRLNALVGKKRLFQRAQFPPVDLIQGAILSGQIKRLETMAAL